MIDSRAKRQSAHRAANAWGRILPNADGTVTQADRQHVLGYYGGILATGLQGFDNVVAGTVKIVRFLAGTGTVVREMGGTATIVRVTGGTVKI